VGFGAFAVLLGPVYAPLSIDEERELLPGVLGFSSGGRVMNGIASEIKCRSVFAPDLPALDPCPITGDKSKGMRIALFVGLILLAPAFVVAACSNDDSAAPAVSGVDSGPVGDGGTTTNEGATGNDAGKTDDSGNTISPDGSIIPSAACKGVGDGTFSSTLDMGDSTYGGGYQIFYEGPNADASAAAFSIACAFTDAGLISHLACPINVDTVQDFPADHKAMTINPTAIGVSVTFSGSVGDD
jgi:hypothetical protein